VAVIDLHDFVGLLGSAAILVAYALVQADRIDVRRRPYSALNAVGAALLLVSLANDFNLGATVIESFWLAISLYGLLRRRVATRT